MTDERPGYSYDTRFNLAYQYVETDEAAAEKAAVGTVEIIPDTLLTDIDASGRVLGIEHIGGPIGVGELVEVIRHLRYAKPDGEQIDKSSVHKIGEQP